MRAKKILTMALAVSAASIGLVISAPTAAMASDGISCTTDGQVGSSSLFYYECTFDAPAGATNESWSGPDLNRSETGGTNAYGECHPQSNPDYFYSVSVSYYVGGTLHMPPATTLFSCPDEL